MRTRSGLARYLVKDPLSSRVKAAWNRHVWCRVVGHDTLAKMDGTRLCRRH